jgi:hypothetical protein
MRTLVLAAAFLLTTVSALAERPPLAHDLARAAGFEHWDRVEAIAFTFNVKTPQREVKRAWRWEPGTGTVTRNPGTADAVTYQRDAVTDEVKEVDAQFINDSYWLLFPFYLVWSDPAVTEAEAKVSSPVNGRWLREVTVQYGDAGGYTPGDTYVLYVDDAGVIREWSFRRPGREPSDVTWEGYGEFNGLRLSTDHRSADGTFRLFFTDVSVESR